MARVDDLSFRLYGDRSMRVAWGDDGTCPCNGTSGITPTACS